MEREKRVEASMPVQSRVDLRTLAELFIYWEKQGVYVSTMSRLVSWSLDALRMILDKNEAIEFKVETLEMAYEILEGKGLLQKSMKKKMAAKFEKSRAMENLRLDGWDVRSSGGRVYEELHPKNEVQPFMAGVKMTDEERKEVEEQVKIYHELERKERDKDLDRQRTLAMKSSKVINVSSESENVKKNVEKMRAADRALEDM